MTCHVMYYQRLQCMCNRRHSTHENSSCCISMELVCRLGQWLRWSYICCWDIPLSWIRMSLHFHWLFATEYALTVTIPSTDSCSDCVVGGWGDLLWFWSKWRKRWRHVVPLTQTKYCFWEIENRKRENISISITHISPISHYIYIYMSYNASLSHMYV